jgi:predicted TPR repeat methyltransferase
VQVQEIFAVDISSSMIAKAREKECYTELYVAELESFYKDQHSLKSYSNTRDVNTIAAADVFVYFSDFSNIIRASVDTLLASTALGPKTIIFTVEALTPALGMHAQLYTLQQSGRYAHSKTYLISMMDSIREAYKDRLLRFEHSIREVVLRKNHGEDVIGYLLRIDISR